MIYLKEMKVIFIKPRKVAGTSFEIALSKYSSKEDVVTPITDNDEKMRESWEGAKNYMYSFPELFSLQKKPTYKLYKFKRPVKFYNHISASEIKNLIGDQAWHESIKVTIVRNPYDRLISQFFYDTRKSKTKIDFEDWCRNNPKTIAINNQQYLIEGKNIIDFYIRYENLEDDIKSLEEKVPKLSGLWEIFKTINAKGNIRPRTATPKEIFSHHPKAKAVVEFFCDYEIEKFNYQLD